MTALRSPLRTRYVGQRDRYIPWFNVGTAQRKREGHPGKKNKKKTKTKNKAVTISTDIFFIGLLKYPARVDVPLQSYRKVH